MVNETEVTSPMNTVVPLNTHGVNISSWIDHRGRWDQASYESASSESTMLLKQRSRWSIH